MVEVKGDKYKNRLPSMSFLLFTSPYLTVIIALSLIKIVFVLWEDKMGFAIILLGGGGVEKLMGKSNIETTSMLCSFPFLVKQDIMGSL